MSSAKGGRTTKLKNVFHQWKAVVAVNTQHNRSLVLKRVLFRKKQLFLHCLFDLRLLWMSCSSQKIMNQLLSCQQQWQKQYISQKNFVYIFLSAGRFSWWIAAGVRGFIVSTLLCWQRVLKIETSISGVPFVVQILLHCCSTLFMWTRKQKLLEYNFFQRNMFIQIFTQVWKFLHKPHKLFYMFTKHRSCTGRTEITLVLFAEHQNLITLHLCVKYLAIGQCLKLILLRIHRGGLWWK